MNLFLAVIISATTAASDQSVVQSAVQARQQVQIDALDQLHIEFGRVSGSRGRSPRARGGRYVGSRGTRRSRGVPRSQRASRGRSRAVRGISPSAVMPMGPAAPTAASPRYSTGLDKKTGGTKGSQTRDESRQEPAFRPLERLDGWNYILHSR